MIVFVVILTAIAVIAAAFAVWPLLRAKNGRSGVNALVVGALAVLIFVVGLGGYFALGQPALAMRHFEALRNDDFPGLIATLAARMRERPNDAAGWMLLGRGYAALGQPGQAAKALKRAVDLSTAQNNLTATLLSDYGEAALQGEGTESQDASNAFARAQALDPKDMKARYYLGLIAATHGKTQEALQLWQSLLADAPPNAPWRQNVVDQVAALNAAAVNAGAAQAPDVQAMVAGLAARLQDNPNDLPGWQRLLRAYAVLGDREKLQAALAQANAIFASNAAAKESLAVAAAGQAR